MRGRREIGFPGDVEVDARLGGRYRFDTEPSLRLIVGVRNDWLMVGTGDVPTARLVHLESDTFHPSGAPGVRFRFLIDGARATGLEIEDGPIVVQGGREPA